MKVGAENKRNLILAAVLGLVAVIAVARIFLQGNSVHEAPVATSSKPAAAPAPANPAARKSAAGREHERYVAEQFTPSLDPRLRLDLLKSSEDVNYEGNGRNIFVEHEDDPMAPIPKPVAGGLTDQVAGGPLPPSVPSGPPPPPPINLRFYGWACSSNPCAQGEPLAVFLVQGDQVFVAHEGQIIASRYKVVKITRSQVEIEDVLSNNRQNITLSTG